MDKNEQNQALPLRGNNSELEKFKRRLIRAVARMLLQEKRNEDEVWEGLRKETGCDCKELWDRMYALTIKKLDRLLKVEDRVDYLPKAARMSITDWLMFDMVLVHEEVDVIGMTETTKEDPKVLVDLFELVEKYKIEFLAGKQLAHAWSQVTLEYNEDIRQCTPMLLQRRWYQLKCVTRARFYKFWFMYKGALQRLHLAEPYRPTLLQIKIAMRYKPLVVKPFMVWEDLIKNMLVILPEEYERKKFDKQGASSDPDVMFIEPNVETIDLDADSDTELEYRKQPKNNKLASVKIKQEPKDTEEVDETVPYESRQEKISNFAEAVMEATAMELDEMDMVEDIDNFMDGNENSQNTDVCSEENSAISPTDEQNMDMGDEISEIPLNDNEVNTDVGVNLLDGTAVSIFEDETANKEIPAVESENVDDSVMIVDEDVHEIPVTETDTTENTQPEIVLPQITSIFGGVDVSNESLSKIGILAAEITKSATKIKDKLPENTINLEKDSVVENISNDVVDIDPDVSETNDNQFNDDCWMMLDDGIAYDDEEFPNPIDSIKTEIVIEEHEVTPTYQQIDEVPKVDSKLLMIPVVYSVKLDDMGILPVNLLNHIDNKALIDIISFKNRPLPKKEVDTVSECSENSLPEIKPVKLSSNLLKKPRSRSYNPIQLCKNPDFNTRLRRLNVGFFSSSRNRLLLKACQPLTIDLSKAFERRLVNGTMYLEPSSDLEPVNEVDLKESNQNVTVVPTAMAVQSLINNTKGDISKPIAYEPVVPKPTEVTHITSERNKVINLPDISEIRRINQKLLTAQVTPLQLKEQVQPANITPANVVSKSAEKTKSVAGPLSRTNPNSSQVASQPRVTNLTKTDQSSTKCWRTIHKPVRWRSKEAVPDIPWISSNNSIYAPDATLLALDTLNKMLFLLTDTEQEKPKVYKKKKYAARKNVLDKPTVLKETQVTLPLTQIPIPVESALTPTGNDDAQVVNDDVQVVNDDVQVVSETKLDSVEANKCRNDKKSTNLRNKRIYCCWARERICQMIFSRKRLAKHSCPYPLCLCCCRNALADYFRKLKEVKVLKRVQPLDSKASTSKVGAKSKTNQHEEVMMSVAQIIPVNVTQTNHLPAAYKLVPAKQNNDSETVTEIVDIDDEVCTEELTAETTALDDCASDEEISVSEEVVVTSENSVSPINVENTVTTTAGVETVKSVSPSISDSAVPVPCVLNPTVSAPSVSISSVPVSTITVSSTSPPLEIVNPAKPAPAININVHAGVRRLSRGRGRPKNTPGNIENKYSHQDVTGINQTNVVTVNKTTEAVDSNHTVTIDNNISYVGMQKFLPPCGDTQKVTTVADFSMSKFIKKTKESPKVIYLNSKQMAELPSEKPIFLGKNKILLTTAKFPANFKAFEAYQRNIKQTLALPKGIELILLPSGRVIYSRDPSVEISPEFIAAMPHLIEAIQQQIDFPAAHNIPLAPPVPPPSDVQSEVIYLSDDETPTEQNNKKSSEHDVSNDNPDQANSAARTSDVNAEETPSSHEQTGTPSSHEQTDNVPDTDKSNEDITHEKDVVIFSSNSQETSESTNKESTATEEATLNNETLTESTINEKVLAVGPNSNNESLVMESNLNKETIVSETPEPLTERQEPLTECPKPLTENPEPLTETPKPLTENAEPLTENPKPLTENPEPLTENPKPLCQATDSEVSENVLQESSGNKTKNILSDLMALSGIGPIDVTLTSDEELIAQTVAQDISPPPQQVLSSLPEQAPSVTPAPKEIASVDLIPQQTILEPSTEKEMVVNHSPQQTEPLVHPSAQTTPVSPQQTLRFTQTIVNDCQILKVISGDGKTMYTPITSLSELKYACSQEGSFFKLDLDTGVLVPINVCMKKIVENAEQRAQCLRAGLAPYNRPIAPKLLTYKATSILTTTNDPKPVIDLTDDDVSGASQVSQPKASRSLLINNRLGNNTTNIAVKPLKLIKSKSGRPHILERKLKQIQKRISEAMIKQDKLRRKLKRKQELTECRDDPNIMEADSEPRLNETREESLDDSSDEEPLAKKAFKKRNAANLENSLNKKADSELVTSVVGEDGVVDLDGDTNDADYTEIECLDEELLEVPLPMGDDDNKEEEDCILGV